MQTDKELYELFASDPGELYELMNRPFPESEVTVGPQQFKQVERTVDLMALPGDPQECSHIIENQGRRDDDLHSRGMISAGLFLAKFPNRSCEVHIIYLSRELDPYSATTKSGRTRKNPKEQPCPNFVPTVHYLDERLLELEQENPESPLLSVFFPIMAENEQELELNFQKHYNHLKQTKALPDAARRKWCMVFQLWMMRSLDKDNLREIEIMVGEHLPPIEETVWGQELIKLHTERGLEQGLEKGLEKVAVKMIEAGKSDDEITEMTELDLQAIKRLRKELDS